LETVKKRCAVFSMDRPVHLTSTIDDINAETCNNILPCIGVESGVEQRRVMGWSRDNLAHCSPPVILQINPASFPSVCPTLPSYRVSQPMAAGFH